MDPSKIEMRVLMFCHAQLFNGRTISFSVHTPDLASTAESQNLLGIGDGLKMDPNQCHWMKERLVGFSGKVAVTGGYREVKQARARAPLEGIEPICAHAVSELKDLAPEADIFVRIIAKNNPLVCKADHFDMMLLELETFPGVKMIAIKPHTGKEHPSVLTSEPISLLEMGKEGKKLQVLPKNQNDKVAALHHEKLRANLTPFKPARSGDTKKKNTKRETVVAFCLFRFGFGFSLFWCHLFMMLYFYDYHDIYRCFEEEVGDLDLRKKMRKKRGMRDEREFTLFGGFNL